MPSQILRTVNTSVSIAGTEFPVLNWKATLATQGSMATAEAEGALSDLVNSGQDIIAVCQDPNGAAFKIRAGYDGNDQLLFSGVVDTVEMKWDENSFCIKGRDLSAFLADGRQTVAGLNYRNQTIGQIVQQIVQQFGFGAQITDPGVMAGAEMNGEHSFTPQPQSYWSLLQGLAEQVGYECYMTPQGNLYFGPEQSQGDVTVNYGALPNSGAENPAWDFKVTYNPRNNSNVTVKVLSYNSQTTQPVVATAHAKPVKVGKGRKTKTSLVGKKSNLQSQGGAAGNNITAAKSIYYIRRSGLTPDQAQQFAQGIADNLAKRQVIVEMSVEGLPSLKLHSQVTVQETTIDLYGFDGIPLNVVEVDHEFSTPDEGSQSGGFVTTFRAVALIENV